MGRVSLRPCTALRFPFDGGLYLLAPADTQNPLVVYMNPMVYIKFVPDAPVSHVRMGFVYLLDFHSNTTVLDLTAAFRVPDPVIVGRAADFKERAQPFYRVSFRLG